MSSMARDFSRILPWESVCHNVEGGNKFKEHIHAANKSYNLLCSLLLRIAWRFQRTVFLMMAAGICNRMPHICPSSVRTLSLPCEVVYPTAADNSCGLKTG